MNEAWSIGVFFRMFSNAKSVLGETTAAAREANAQLNGHTKAMDGASRSASAASGAFKNAAGSIAASGQAASRARSSYIALGDTLKNIAKFGSYAALGTAAIGVKTAADLQDAYTQIGAQSGRSGQSVQSSYSDMLLSVSKRTGVSMKDALGITSEVAGVIKDQKELRAAIAGVGSSGGIIDFVNVLKRSNVSTGSDESTAKDVITLDHILNSYTAPAMAHVQDRLYRAAVGSHMDLKPLVTQISYFGEQFRLAGGNRSTNVDDIMQLAELGYWGMGKGKWGAGFGQILRTINKPSKNNVSALKALGIMDANGKYDSSVVDAQGQFTPMAMIEHARGVTAGMRPMDIQALVNRAFPANAARTMAEALSPKTRAFLARLDASQGNMQPLMQLQAEYMGNLNEATDNLRKQFENLAATLAMPWLTSITKPIKALGDFFGNLAQYFNAHPGEAKLAGGIVGAGALYGAYNLAKMTGNFAGVGLEIAKHGTRARIFGGHHLNGAGAAEDLAKAPNLFERFGASFGKALFETASLRSSRGLFGGIVSGIKAGPSMMGLSPEFKSGFMRDMGLGFKGLPGIGRLSGAFSVLGDVISKVGVRLYVGRIGLEMLAGGLLRLGLRFIPVVGEVLMLIDTLKFLGSHAKEIGKILADVAHWIIVHGVPMVVDAFVSMVKAIVIAVKDTFIGMFHGFKGGIWDSLKTGFDSFKKEWAAQDKNDHASSRPQATPVNHGPVMHIGKVENHFNQGHPEKHAAAFIDTLVKLSPQAIKTLGGAGTPRMARPVYSA